MCVFRFSRKLIWLKLSSTNHDPKVVARYYLESIEKAEGTSIFCKYKFCIHIHMYIYIRCTYIYIYIYIYTGCPRILRADHGTENVIVAQLQIAFRMEHNDRLAGAKSFIYGPSTANIVCTYIYICYRVYVTNTLALQRIEAWWSQLWRFKTNWWIDLCQVISLMDLNIPWKVPDFQWYWK